jgi:hypothetical protein
MKLARLVRWLPLVLLVVLLGVDLEALALPRDPAPRPTLRPAQTEVKVAQRRRRRGHHPPAARPKKPKATPKAEPAEKPVAPEPAGGGGGAPAAGPGDPGALQRGGRVEFDGRLVQGQTAKSGAIYLFARQRTDLRSMVRERDTYRREVLRTVYPDWNK